jgi:hypothetical protein
VVAMVEKRWIRGQSMKDKSFENLAFRTEKGEIVFGNTGKMRTFALPKISDHG